MSDSTSYPPRSSRRSRLNYSSSFKGPTKSSEQHFNRDSELRHSTGSIKGKRADSTMSSPKQAGKESEDGVDGSHSVHNLIKNFQSKVGNGSTKRNSNGSSETYSYQSDGYKTPGYVAETPATERGKRPTTKRKLSLRYKKGRITADDARFNILQSLGMSPFAGNEGRGEEKAFAYFDTQSLFFAFLNAATLKLLYEEGSSYTKKLTGASAASARSAAGRKRVKSGEFDPVTGRFRSRTESILDEGDDKENQLVLKCPYFRNEIAESEDSEVSAGEPTSKHGRDIAKLISMFNRNRSFENLRNDLYDHNKRHSRSRREFQSSEQDILLEEVKDDSSFLTWDEPNVSGKRIFDFEHIDRGAMYYREYFADKDHINLFGIDEKHGPMAISIIREVIPKMAVLGHNSSENNEKNKKYHYRMIVRTCELYALRITVLENSIPSTSRHGGSSRGIPVKDILEYCFPQIQHTCLRHAVPGPKISEQLIKLDEQQLTLKYKIGLIYCKSGQTTEEEMYNNEKGGSEFLEFCSVIADKVALKGFQGYRAQLDNKNDSTGAHSLYTTFHGREVMFHVSTELPFTGNDRQQLLRKRHIGNDIVTVIFQEPGSVPFTAQMMRSHFQHVFIVVRVENPHTEFTKYEVAVSRSRDVPYFGPPIPPNHFNKNAAFREFLLSKLINAENAAHKSDKFTHMARRTRYEYLKDLATNQVSSQTIEHVNKFAFSFGSKKKEKNHPPVSPEIWLQGGMVWTVKFDFEHDGQGSSAYLSISTKSVVFVEQSTQELLLSIPCKSVLGWRPTSHTLKLFYDNGKMAYFSLCDDDLNELPYVVNRLKAVTPGCETQDLSLRRNNDGQLGFHVFYEGLVAEVEPYGLAWQAGLRKGSRLLEISGHVVGSMSHERMILMLKRPGVVRIVVLPPAPDGQPRNYRAVRNLRRYSSMTSVYSMSAATLAGIGDSSSMYSSKEYLTGSPSGSSPQQENTPMSVQKDRSFSAGSITRNESQNSSSSRSSDSTSQDLPNQQRTGFTEKQKHIELGQSTERLIASRSATDITTQSRPVPSGKKQAVLLPTQSVEQELGEIERQLTDTRKSIDAKFYRSLANSPSPFFRNSKSSPEAIQEPTEEPRPLTEEVFSEGHKNTSVKPVAVIVARRASDLHYPIVNERVNSALSRETSATSGMVNGTGQTESLENDHAMRKVNRNSLEQAFENSQVPPTPTTTSSVTHISKVPPAKPPRQFLRKSEPVDIEIDPKLGVISLKRTESDDKRNPAELNDNSYSDSSVGRSKSQENLMYDKDSDHGRKGHFVRTKVRDAKEIISERRSLRGSPDPMHHEMMKKSLSMEQPNDKKQTVSKANRNSLGSKQFFTNNSSDLFIPTSPVGSPKHGMARSTRSPQSSPRLSARNNELVRAIDTAARNKSHQYNRQTAGTPPTHHKAELRSNILKSGEENKLDDSLTETFAKLDAAFGFKSGGGTPPRDEKRKKKRSSRCRSRNFEPPTSDSSDEFTPDLKRRGSRTPRRQTPDEASIPSLPKSEAEESLEAAISEFHMELSTMPEKTRSGSFTNAISSGSRPPPPYETSSPSTTPRDERSLAFNKIPSSTHQTTRPNDDHPPKIPLRTSRPQILIDHQKLKQRQLSLENKTVTNTFPVKETRKFSEPFAQQRTSRVRSEAKVSLTSLRPWSPPLSRPQKSSYIKDNIKECSSKSVASKSVAAKVAVYDKNTVSEPKAIPVADVPHGKDTSDKTESEKLVTKKPELSKLTLTHRDSKESEVEVAEEVFERKENQPEDQLSPLPQLAITPNRGGIHSLPNRSKKRRMTVNETTIKSSSASCIPLLVRGLDLAATKDPSSVPWSKEDLHVMIAVMENELAQEREEKERLSQELNRSREEKERLLEQSKQAASQLRKFTSLFLDASPQELEKAKQRYSDGR